MGAGPLPRCRACFFVLTACSLLPRFPSACCLTSFASQTSAHLTAKSPYKLRSNPLTQVSTQTRALYRFAPPPLPRARCGVPGLADDQPGRRVEGGVPARQAAQTGRCVSIIPLSVLSRPPADVYPVPRYREQGRSLKHSGDRVAREAQSAQSVQSATLAVCQQMEAILLYVFAFWCDDQASRNCLATNWHSIFGLLSFVKRAAEKQGLAVILGLCLRVEALTCQVLSTHEQKTLNYKGVQHASAAAGPSPVAHPAGASPAGSHHTNASSAGGSPPNPNTGLHPPPPTSGAPSSAGPPAPPPPIDPTQLVKSFTSASSALFRISRLLADSNDILSPALLADFCPRTWHACTEANRGVSPASVHVPRRQEGPAEEEGEVGAGGGGRWVFAWPVEMASNTAAPHVVGFARCLLEEWAETMECGYKVAEVLE